MIYDGLNLSHYMKVEAIRRPLLAPVWLDTKDVAGVDGTTLRHVRLEPKTIEVDVRLIEGVWGVERQRYTIDRLRRKLAGALLRRGKRKLVLHDAPDLYEMAVLDGSTSLEAFSYTRFATLTWMCDPASYGATRRKESSGGQLSALVDGTYPTAPVVTATARGPLTITFDGVPFELYSGSGSVVLDAAEHTAYQAGQRVAYSIFSDFPEWTPGIHTVSCPVPFKLEWTERWL